MVEVVIAFEEDTKVPRFPLLNPTLPRSATENAAVLDAIGKGIERVKSERAPRQLTKAESLNRDQGVRVSESFWLTNAVVAEMPLAALNGLANRPDILSIDPRYTDDAPPQTSVADGRARINSDPYFNANLTGGFIGLLDSGVRVSHTLHSNSTHIDILEDCTGTACNNVPNPADTCGHGTSSAAIITGNSNMGNAFGHCYRKQRY